MFVTDDNETASRPRLPELLRGVRFVRRVAVEEKVEPDAQFRQQQWIETTIAQKLDEPAIVISPQQPQNDAVTQLREERTEFIA